MGAVPHEGGTGFRVWAPHADRVGVEGSFNGWDADRHPMQAEDDGYWYADVAGSGHGDEYRFVIHRGDQELHRIDPYARQVTNSVGNAVVHDHRLFDWHHDDFWLPRRHELVIYEAHVGTFFDAPGDQPGTFALAAEKLDHLVHLGVTAIQLMPVAEFSGDFSWGYNPAHIFAVESTYGGPDALKSFVLEAHRRGIGVLIDVVYNHLGPGDLSLWRFDGWSENDLGGIYFYNDDRARTPWGDTRPDYRRGEVRRFLRDNALMWLRDYHADGLRFDMTPYIHSVDGGGTPLPEGWSLLRWINTSVHEQFPGRITIAEDMRGNPRITTFDDSGVGFDSQWDGRFVHPIRAAIEAYGDEGRSLRDVAEAVSVLYDGDPFHRVIYTESHDEVANGKSRVVNEINPHDEHSWWSQKRSTLGAALVLTSPGIPMLFQGQEFLEGGWFRDDVPLDWHLHRQFHGIVHLYSDLVSLRLNEDGATAGLQGTGLHIFHRNDAALVMAFHRWRDGGVGDDVVVVINLSDDAFPEYRIGFPAPGLWRLRFNSDAAVYCDDFGDFRSVDVTATADGYDGQRASGTVGIAPYTALIYSREE